MTSHLISIYNRIPGNDLDRGVKAAAKITAITKMLDMLKTIIARRETSPHVAAQLADVMEGAMADMSDMF